MTVGAPHALTRIRMRQDADLPALAQVLIEVHAHGGYPVEGVADPVNWLRIERLLGAWVAESGGKLVGQVGLASPSRGDEAVDLWIELSGSEIDSVAVLGRLFVSPHARGQRLGQRLTDVAMEHARRLGKRAVLDVMAKDVAAIRTYENLGWERLGPIRHSYGEAEIEPAFAYVSPAE
jgi:ribosomal protein S18 acetylase RimI-like enzyme